MKWIGVPIWIVILAMFGPFYFWFMLSDEIARKRQRQRTEDRGKKQVGWYRKYLGR